MSNNEIVVNVAHLTKSYPGCRAVDDVSFSVRKGEIVGLLGPNGAGKSTTMRILSCYMPASEGVVQVAGHDVFRESMQVRKRIGYMPEHVPLYPEMRVDEYLRFRGRLKQVARSRLSRRIADVKTLCGLDAMGRKLIGHLSKGYCQRVGLADALINEPDLLILDEPTIGLDPNQIREVRGLIKHLAEKHTILLSTHILSEAEMICERVLILNRGTIVASDTPDKLRVHLKGGRQFVAEIDGSVSDVRQQLMGISGVEEVVVREEGAWCRCLVSTGSDIDVRSDIFELVAKAGWLLRELKEDTKSLEDVFVALTKEETSRSE